MTATSPESTTRPGLRCRSGAPTLRSKSHCFRGPSAVPALRRCAIPPGHRSRARRMSPQSHPGTVLTSPNTLSMVVRDWPTASWPAPVISSMNTLRCSGPVAEWGTRLPSSTNRGTERASSRMAGPVSGGEFGFAARRPSRVRRTRLRPVAIPHSLIAASLAAKAPPRSDMPSERAKPVLDTSPENSREIILATSIDALRLISGYSQSPKRAIQAFQTSGTTSDTGSLIQRAVWAVSGRPKLDCRSGKTHICRTSTSSQTAPAPFCRKTRRRSSKVAARPGCFHSLRRHHAALLLYIC